MSESMELKEVLAPFEERATRVLATTFRGMHHCPKVFKKYEGTNFELWEVNTHSDLSTYDYDQLTRLVICAHDECVRVEVAPSGPGMLKIRLWPRQRDGAMTERHPTIEQAIESVRASKWKN